MKGNVNALSQKAERHAIHEMEFIKSRRLKGLICGFTLVLNFRSCFEI